MQSFVYLFHVNSIYRIVMLRRANKIIVGKIKILQNFQGRKNYGGLRLVQKQRKKQNREQKPFTTRKQLLGLFFFFLLRKNGGFKPWDRDQMPPLRRLTYEKFGILRIQHQSVLHRSILKMINDSDWFQETSEWTVSPFIRDSFSMVSFVWWPSSDSFSLTYIALLQL